MKDLLQARYELRSITRIVRIVQYIPGLLGHREKMETDIINVCSDEDFNKFVEIVGQYEDEISELRSKLWDLERRNESKINLLKRLLKSARER